MIFMNPLRRFAWKLEPSQGDRECGARKSQASTFDRATMARRMAETCARQQESSPIEDSTEEFTFGKCHFIDGAESGVLP